MEKLSKSENDKLKKLFDQVEDLQSRISRLEEQNEIILSGNLVTTEGFEQDTEAWNGFSNGRENESIESRLGENGMAWLGNIVLLFGIIFLLQMLGNQGLKLISAVAGIVAVGGVYLLGKTLSKNHPLMSKLFTYNGHFLLFYVIMRLHFISAEPLIKSTAPGLILVLVMIGGIIYTSYRNKSQLLASIALLMLVTLAIFSNSTHITLSLMVVIAILSVYLALRLGWWNVLILSVFLVYSTFLMWLVNNPIVNHSLEVVSNHQYSHLYLFGFALIYSGLALLKSNDKIEDYILNRVIIINSTWFTLTMSLVIIAFFSTNYVFLLGLISVFCLVYSIILQSRGDWKHISALYALYSFVVLSVTISVIYKLPLAFLLLSIQSLLVVSMALWFRSKFIVIMNTVLFICILLAYLLFNESINSINFAFAAVALTTARVMNWKKKRLEIQTELIRNLYLFAGFIMTLISLYKAVPAKFITLSWTLSALLFFILSILLSNVKYRWLAITTMIVTAIYLFMFDMKNISIGIRIVALLFLAIISLGISIYYTRRTKIKEAEGEG